MRLDDLARDLSPLTLQWRVTRAPRENRYATWTDVLAHQQGDRRATARLIAQNEGFLFKLCGRYSRATGAPMSDLLQEARMGLAHGFSMCKIAKAGQSAPASYALWHARAYVGKFCADHATTVRVPKHKRATHRSTNVSIEDVTLTAGAPEDSVDRFRIPSLMSALTEKEKLVVSLYYGLNDDVPATVQSIGQDLGCSRQNVERLRLRAIARMRTLLRSDEDSH